MFEDNYTAKKSSFPLKISSVYVTNMFYIFIYIYLYLYIYLFIYMYIYVYIRIYYTEEAFVGRNTSKHVGSSIIFTHKFLLSTVHLHIYKWTICIYKWITYTHVIIYTHLITPMNPLHSCDDLQKTSIKINVMTDEGKQPKWNGTLNKLWNWSSCTKMTLSASWTHGLVTQSVRPSKRNSVVVGSNPTQANFL